MKRKRIPLYVISFITAFILGLCVGLLLTKQPAEKIVISNSLEEPITTNALYSAQTANIHGQIIAVDGSVLTVLNTTNNVTGKILASSTVMIMYPETAETNASSDLSSLKLNQDVFIGLEVRNGIYLATVIQYTNSL